MSKVFISYRRSDSQDVVGRIYDRLANAFSPATVFRDLDSIPLAVPFQHFLQQTLEQCDTVLVVIGPTWASATDSADKRRLDDPTDFVRMEVETALRLERPVIPVTVTHAEIPRPEDIPASLRPLIQRNGLPVRPDPDFHKDMEKLIAALGGMGIEATGDSEWQETPFTSNPSTYLAEGETFTSTGRFQAGNNQLRLAPAQRLFLRVIPKTRLSTIQSSMNTLQLVQSGRLLPMAGRDIDGYFHERNRHGAFACQQVNGEIWSLSQLFKHGELWGIDAFTIDAKRLRETPVGQPFFAPDYIEDEFCLTLTNYLTFMRETLQLKPPFLMRAGATDVQGYRMAYRNALGGIGGNVVDQHILFSDIIHDFDTEVAFVLRPFFEYLWEECGLRRPDVDVGRLP